MTLKSSLVIFLGLRTSAASMTSVASATLLASTASKCQFPQKISRCWCSDHRRNLYFWLDNWGFVKTFDWILKQEFNFLHGLQLNYGSTVSGLVFLWAAAAVDTKWPRRKFEGTSKGREKVWKSEGMNSNMVGIICHTMRINLPKMLSVLKYWINFCLSLVKTKVDILGPDCSHITFE